MIKCFWLLKTVTKVTTKATHHVFHSHRYRKYIVTKVFHNTLKHKWVCVSLGVPTVVTSTSPIWISLWPKDNFDPSTVTTMTVPEPASWLLFLSFVAVFPFLIRQRTK